MYDVSFSKGSYDAVFGASPDFTDSASAHIAATSLAAALNSPSALPVGITSDPTQVNGLTYPTDGYIYIPWEPLKNYINYTSSVEWHSYNPTSWGVADGTIHGGDETVFPWLVFAKFNPVASVPEPDEYLMMLLGAGLVAFQVKRKQKAI